MTRTEAGPFIVLGVDKDIDPAALPEICADRQDAARRGELRWSEDDIVWALEQLRDLARRPAIDAACFNSDIATGEVRRLARLFRVDDAPPGWELMDPEPPAELPDADLDAGALAAELPTPDVSLELPSVVQWLENYAKGAGDPWAVELSG